MGWIVTLALIGTAIIGVRSLRAQERGTLVGTVRDPTGLPVESGNVQLFNIQTGVILRAITNSSGGVCFRSPAQRRLLPACFGAEFSRTRGRWHRNPRGNHSPAGCDFGTVPTKQYGSGGSVDAYGEDRNRGNRPVNRYGTNCGSTAEWARRIFAASVDGGG